jgi:hypothetical protein
LTQFAPPPRRNAARFALRVDHNGGTFIHQEIWDEGAAPLAGPSWRNGDEMAFAIQPQTLMLGRVDRGSCAKSDTRAFLLLAPADQQLVARAR